MPVNANAGLLMIINITLPCDVRKVLALQSSSQYTRGGTLHEARPCVAVPRQDTTLNNPQTQPTAFPLLHIHLTTSFAR